MKQYHPTREECFKYLNDYGTPTHVQRHCIAVTGVALAVGEALNEHGFSFDLSTVQSAGLLHDIARTEDKHWEKGAQFAEAHGFFDEAYIIKKHMNYSLCNRAENLREIDLVCLGDRLVQENKYVGLDQRMEYVIQKSNNDPVVRKLIEHEKIFVKLLIEEIESIIGMNLNELIERKEYFFEVYGQKQSSYGVR